MELEKRLNIYKHDLDEVNERFGGLNSIDEQIRIAKLKERSVQQLLNQLDGTMSSIECSLSCRVCKDLFDQPVMNWPCCHVNCRRC